MGESKSIEASGPDIEAAISSGIAELGVSRSDVIVEIIDEPSRGLLGLGARPAKVRLTVIRAPAAPPAPPAKIVSDMPVNTSTVAGSNTNTEGRSNESRASGTNSISSTGRESSSTGSSRDSYSRSQGRSGGAESRYGSRRPDRSEHRSDQSRRTSDRPYASSGTRSDEYDDDWSSESLTADELAEDARIGADTLRELLRQMNVEAKVTSQPANPEDDEEEHWSLEIQGRDLGALIGRRGETLAALQYITRLIASRNLERRVNIVIDVEGYKSRRESILRRLATRMAEQAIQRGRTVSLEPMPPHERRIIHLALRDNPNVTTESVGDGDRRKVTIVPRKNK